MMAAAGKNYVALLNEDAQKKGWKVDYVDVGTEGQDHIKTFTMRAVLNNQIFPDGSGRTKKEAKQNAAKNVLSCLEKEEPANSVNDDCSSEFFTKFTQANYTCWLNEYAQKNRLIFEAKERTKMNSQLCLNACKYVCGDTEFPEAEGKGKKEAKEAAAKLVYDKLSKERKTEVLDENCKEAEIPKMPAPCSAMSCLSLNSQENTESSTEDINFIGKLNHYCQTNKLVIDFKLVEKRGPPHNPEFVYKVVTNKKEYPEGLGKTVKDAKQHAARLALSELQEQLDLESETSAISMVSEEDSPLQTPMVETESDVSLSISESIVFRNSSVSLQSINKCVPKSSPFEAKPKKKLAPNFCFSPKGSKQEGPNMNVHSTPTQKPPAVSSSTKSRFLEDFHSISPIGKGGFGRVFKARKKLDQRCYAVKIVKFTEKALREVSALADLAHANIVRYYTSWTEDTAYRCESSESYSTSNSNSGSASKFLYIQMELCEGETLRVWIDNAHSKQSSQRRQDAAHIMKQVLQAVQYIHSKKLIHRDLKPPNIMFGNEGGVKVGDFGLVTAAEGDNDKGLLERTKHTGTRSYMSPEQKNQDSYDNKVDIFALGLIYFELLWHLGTVNEKQTIWEDLRSKVLPKQFHLSFGFEHNLIDKMLHANPEERPDTSELLTELNGFSAWMDHSTHRNAQTY